MLLILIILLPTRSTRTDTLFPNTTLCRSQPLPQFKNVQDNGSAEGSYFAWVDQFDTLGLGANTPIATGNQSDAFLALKDGKWVRSEEQTSELQFLMRISYAVFCLKKNTIRVMLNEHTHQHAQLTSNI